MLQIVYSLLKIYFKSLIGKDISPLEYNNLIKSWVQKTNNHRIYEILLRMCDRTIVLTKMSKTSFVGKGRSHGSLNIYRKVVVPENDIYFEKVYFVNSIDHQRILFFYKNIYPELAKTKLNIPSLRFVKTGKKLALFYSDFINLKEIKRSQKFELSLQYYSIYSSLNLSKKFQELEDFHNFTKDTMYLKCKERLVKKLKHISLENEVQIYLQEIEQRIKQCRMIFQHGDLNIRNMYQDFCLIDWDRSSFYPIGYDLGIIFAEKIHNDCLESKKIDQLILNNLVSYNWEDHFFSVKYFTMLFLTFWGYDIKPLFQDLVMYKDSYYLISQQK